MATVEPEVSTRKTPHSDLLNETGTVDVHSGIHTSKQVLQDLRSGTCGTGRTPAILWGEFVASLGTDGVFGQLTDAEVKQHARRHSKTR